MENIKTHLTAIVRKKISLPMEYLKEQCLLKGKVLDYGCGRGFDVQALNIQGYDPHYSPEMPKCKFDTITCNYVLNVVDKEIELLILKTIKALLKKNGVAYISVRRDKFNEGFTSKKTFQRFVELDLEVVNKKPGSYIMYKLTR